MRPWHNLWRKWARLGAKCAVGAATRKAISFHVAAAGNGVSRAGKQRWLSRDKCQVIQTLLPLVSCVKIAFEASTDKINSVSLRLSPPPLPALRSSRRRLLLSDRLLAGSSKQRAMDALLAYSDDDDDAAHPASVPVQQQQQQQQRPSASFPRPAAVKPAGVIVFKLPAMRSTAADDGDDAPPATQVSSCICFRTNT